MTKFLMSAEHPGGFKLEDVLLDVITDLRTKNRRNAGNTDTASVSIAENNRAIINHLAEALEFQRNTIEILDAIGPDQGPRGKPRIPSAAEPVGPKTSQFTLYTGDGKGELSTALNADLHFNGVPIKFLMAASVENAIEVDNVTVSILRIKVANPTPVICGRAPKD